MQLESEAVHKQRALIRLKLESRSLENSSERPPAPRNRLQLPPDALGFH